MSATTYPWNEAVLHVRHGALVDSTLFIQQLLVWEMSGIFNEAIITELIQSLDPETASAGTRYGWIVAEDKEFIVLRNYEMTRKPPLKRQ